ncbi:MAG TPA: UvrD-helicase domain-containing protein [Thermoanaerobaculia bacterium]|nr:UvrD-helicase domain-containing protein [Thermoanaerobaculia bacterium]
MNKAVIQEIERQLNPEQVAAVTHGEGPQLVLAGAGSGKTRVITYRIYWLIEEMGVDPGHIAAMTFTNKAAGEMRERVEDLIGIHPLPTSVGTFHRYGLLLLRRYGERIGLRRDFHILDSADQLGLVKEALGAEGLSETAFSPRSVLGQISSAKNRLIDAAAYESRAQNFFEKKIAAIYRRYQGLLGQASGVDFDDLIGLAVKLLATDGELRERIRRRTQFLLVDEYQDTNHAQLRLVQELNGSDGNLTAVGDEDQGIYRWRGADLNNILEFEKTFPNAVVRKLERNYRSTQTILDVSGALIAHNVNRRGKRLWTDSGPGVKAELYKASDENDEASWIIRTLQRLRANLKLSEMAVLVRTNAQTRAIEDELLAQEIPYSLVGGVRFYERAEIKDLVAYLRVLRNPRDNFSLMRIVNQPPRGIGKSTLELLRDRAVQLGQPLWDVLYLDDLGTLPARSASALRKFRDLIVGLQHTASELPLPALLDRLLEATAFTDLFKQDDPDDVARLENIQEFLSAAQEFTEAHSYNNASDQDLLTSFLDHIALVTDLDALQSEKGVSLMTLHSAKGLEFRAVVVAGLENGVLPHFNSQGAQEDVEEERRLLYVGMTRAREKLFLTCCRRRRIAGRYQDQAESPFLSELPPALLNVTASPDFFYSERPDPRAQGVYSFFNQGRPASGPPPAAPPPRSFPPQPPSGFSRPAPPSPVGRRVVPDPEQIAPRHAIRRGSRVRHPTLGPGVVLEFEGEGDEARLTVFFEKSGKRKLVAKFANLEML